MSHSKRCTPMRGSATIERAPARLSLTISWIPQYPKLCIFIKAAKDESAASRLQQLTFTCLALISCRKQPMKATLRVVRRGHRCRTWHPCPDVHTGQQQARRTQGPAAKERSRKGCSMLWIASTNASCYSSGCARRSNPSMPCIQPTHSTIRDLVGSGRSLTGTAGLPQHGSLARPASSVLSNTTLIAESSSWTAATTPRGMDTHLNGSTSVARPAFGGTFETEHCSRISFQPVRLYRVVALAASSENARFDSLNGRKQATPGHAKPAQRALGHCLLLQGVHPGEPTDAGLVQRNWRRGPLNLLDSCFESGQIRLDAIAKWFEVDGHVLSPKQVRISGRIAEIVKS